jgi:hypothetical protein
MRVTFMPVCLAISATLGCRGGDDDAAGSTASSSDDGPMPPSTGDPGPDSSGSPGSSGGDSSSSEAGGADHGLDSSGGGSSAAGSSEGSDTTGAPSCIDLDAGSSVPQSLSGDTTGAGDDFLPSCARNGSADTLIGFTAPAPGFYQFDTFGSPGDTVLFALDQCEGAEIECSDDALDMFQSRVNLDLAAGQAVVLGVEDFDGLAGPFTFNVTFLGDVIDCCVFHHPAGCEDPAVEACVCLQQGTCCGNPNDAWGVGCAELAVECGAEC